MSKPRRGFDWFAFRPREFLLDPDLEAMTAEAIGAHVLFSPERGAKSPCTIPKDDSVLARWARTPAERWTDIREIVLKPFELRRGRLFCSKLHAEYLACKRKYTAQSEGGKTGANKRHRANKLDGLPMSNPKDRLSIARENGTDGTERITTEGTEGTERKDDTAAIGSALGKEVNVPHRPVDASPLNVGSMGPSAQSAGFHRAGEVLEKPLLAASIRSALLSGAKRANPQLTWEPPDESIVQQITDVAGTLSGTEIEDVIEATALERRAEPIRSYAYFVPVLKAAALHATRKAATR